MKIKRLQVIGFKSFANKEEFIFEDGINVIIGPNGCGKSNLIDAIKFALGENNPSEFGVKKLNEVIFFGCEQKNKSNMAQVDLEIEIDNNKKTIKLTRRLFSSGENQFFINQKLVKFKELLDFLVLNNLSGGFFSFIKQNQIEKVVSQDGVILGQFIEQAAGLEKFLKTIQEVYSKQPSINWNIQRIEDILSFSQNELEAIYKEYLKYQQYNELKKQLDNLKQKIYIQQRQKLQLSLERIKKRLFEIQQEKEALETQQDKKYKLLISQEEELLKMEEEYSLRFKRLNEIQATINQLVKKINELKDKEHLQKDLFEVKKEIEEKNCQLEKLKENLQEIERDSSKLTDFQKILEEKKRDYLILEQQLKEVNQKLIRLNQIKDKVKETPNKKALEALLLELEGVNIYDDINLAKPELKKSQFRVIIKKFLRKNKEKFSKFLKDDCWQKGVIDCIFSNLEVVEDLSFCQFLDEFITKDGIFYKKGLIEKKENPSELIEKKEIFEKKLEELKKDIESLNEKKESYEKLKEQQIIISTKIAQITLEINKKESIYQQILERLKDFSIKDSISDEIKFLNEKLKEKEDELLKIQRQQDEFLAQLKGKKERLKATQRELEIIKTKLQEKLKDFYQLKSQEERLKEKLNTYEFVIFEEKDNDYKELRNIEKRIEELGAINFLAEEKYDEKLKKHHFIEDVYKDLVFTKNKLYEFVEKLKEYKDKAFKEAFLKINQNFKSIFKELFSTDATGELRLSKEDGVYKVSIFARPAGKLIKRINLLSGGEKALTALAFLFSLFLYQNDGFCILDEADAPLDDANSFKFTKLLKKLSSSVQFIIITHNKKTIEAGDVVYGITTQPPGISKIVSVKFK